MGVTTYFGRIADRKACRYISGHFYEMGLECVHVDGQWHRVHNSKIGFDIAADTWRKMEKIPEYYSKVLLSITEGIPFYGYMELSKEEKLEYVYVSRTYGNSQKVNNITEQIRAHLEKGIDSAEALQNYEAYASRPRKGKTKTIQDWYKTTFRPRMEKILHDVENSEFMNYSNVLCREDVAIKLGHEENPEDGVFYFKENLDSRSRKKFNSHTTYPLKMYGRAYSTNGHRQEAMTRETSNIYVHKLPENGMDRMLARFVPYMWGVEHETIRGFIAEHRLAKIGVIPLRDGSLDIGGGMSGLEYTSIPLIGEEGFRLLRKQAELLTAHCDISNQCSYHIHFSGFPLNWKYVMNLYNLCYKLQNEIYTMFPAYKCHSRELIGTSKEYTAPLRSMSSVKALFGYLSGDMDPLEAETRGMLLSQKGDIAHIPLNIHPHGSSKWNRPARYHWVNFEPVIFSEGHTVEFRMHTPTTNFTKMAAWMLICSAILKAAGLKKWESPKLADIIKAAYHGSNEADTIAQFLIAYIEERKSWFSGRKDPEGLEEIRRDAQFSFELDGFTI